MAQNKPTDTSSDELNDIDFILKDVGGTFGRFQIYNYLMFSFSIFISGAIVLDYVFTALEIDHRCAFVECEMPKTFNPAWLENAVPFENDLPKNCYRFERISDIDEMRSQCDAKSFNRSAISNCDNGSMVFRTDELSIVNEFNLTCDENRWKIAMVGTYSNIGRLIALSICGYLSDRYGRKRLLITSHLLGSTIKLLKSFAANYQMFVAFEMFDAGISSAIYPSALILSMEWVSTEHSILVSSLVLSTYSLGQVAMASIASYLHNYKWLLRVLSLLGFLTFPYIWTVPESLRWLLVKRKYKEALDVIVRAAKINKIDLSTKTYQILASKCEIHNGHANNGDVVNNGINGAQHKNGSFIDIITNRLLFIRLLICAFCWATTAFVTYGVSIISVSLSGDKYINFMVVALGAMPATILTYLMMKYLSRRWTMCASLVITGVAILASKYSSSNAALTLTLFFIGKMFVHHSFTSLYLYTNEMWPTVLRHTVMGINSTIARLGSIAAPLTPLLISVWELLPFYLFSGFAFSAALAILFLPETFRQKKLPDSIDEIKNIGKKQQNS